MDLAAWRRLEQRRIQGCVGDLQHLGCGGEGPLLRHHGSGLLERVAQRAAPAAFDHDAVSAPAAPATHATAGQRAVRLVAAGKRRREIGVPAIGFHLHVRLIAGVGTGLHDHRGLDVARFVAEHLLALAGVGRAPADRDDAALARERFGYSPGSRPIVPSAGVADGVSPPPIDMTMQWSPLMVIMRF